MATRPDCLEPPTTKVCRRALEEDLTTENMIVPTRKGDSGQCNFLSFPTAANTYCLRSHQKVEPFTQSHCIFGGWLISRLSQRTVDFFAFSCCKRQNTLRCAIHQYPNLASGWKRCRGRDGYIRQNPSCLGLAHKGITVEGVSTRCIFLRPLLADSLSILLVFLVVLSNVGRKRVIWIRSAQQCLHR